MTSSSTRAGARPSGASLVGRGEVLATLTGLLDAAIAGHGGARSIVAEAGAGKTAVLDEVHALALDRSMQVQRIVGVEHDVDLPWAALGALCVGHRDRFAELPEPQARALEVAFALASGPEHADRLAVSLGVLGLLSELSVDQPLVVLVDDVHWLDPESRRAIDFVARAVGDDRIALVVAGRPDDGPIPNERVELPGLADDAVDRLLIAEGVLSVAARHEITAAVDGNPLLAKQVVHALSPAERAGTRPLRRPLPAPEALEDVFAAQLGRLSARQQEALLVVAACGAERTATLDDLRAAGFGLADLEAAELAGLVVIAPDGVHFSHPLARGAVYHQAPAPRRRRVHLDLAEREGHDTARGVLHRAAATVGNDAELAADLGALADDAHARGAPLTAAERWAQAAEVAPPGAARSAMLLRAADSALAAGAYRWADALLQQARAADLDRAGGLDAGRIEVRLAVIAGRYQEARSLAAAIDDQFSGTHPAQVIEILTDVARTLLATEPTQAVEVCERVGALARTVAQPASLYAEIIYGCGRFVQLDPSAADSVERWPELLEVEGAVVAGPFLAETVAMYLSVLGRTDEALALLDRIEPVVREQCASSALVSILAARSHVLYRVDLRRSVEAGQQAWDLAEAAGIAGLAPHAVHAMVMAGAAIGDEALVARAAERCLASGTPTGLAYGHSGRARLHLVLDRPEQAAAEFDALRRSFGEVNTTVCRFEGDELDAYVRVGRRADAERALGHLDAFRHVGPWALGQHERGLALLATDLDEAVAHFEAAAQAYARQANVVGEGLNELSWGERLRRARHRAEARRHLERAVALFGSIGATALRRRANRELLAAGGIGDRDRPTDELLAPIELQVARLAAAHATNRDIASELFISPRTVENHLSAVYRKLGLSGRAQLARRASTDAVLRSRGTVAKVG